MNLFNQAGTERKKILGILTLSDNTLIAIMRWRRRRYVEHQPEHEGASQLYPEHTNWVIFTKFYLRMKDMPFSAALKREANCGNLKSKCYKLQY